VHGDPRYFLTTARLGFRCWSADDLPLALALWGDAAVTRFIGGPFSADQIRQRLDDEIAMMRAHGVQYWPLFLLRDGEHVGCGGLRPYRAEHSIYEMGFHLRPEYWGRGLAVEIGAALSAYAFGTLRAATLVAGHHPHNTASQRVLEKLGFRFTHEEFYLPTGLRHRTYALVHP
jgi:[ribosomal protein S5]-alanine N-acetyltransferase